MNRINTFITSLILLAGASSATAAEVYNKTQTQWDLDTRMFSDNGTLILTVMRNGQPVANADVGVFAVADDVCRGGNWTNDDGLVGLMTYGNSNNEEMYFKIRVGDKVYRAPETYFYLKDDIRSITTHGVLNLDSMENTVQLPPVKINTSTAKQTVKPMLHLDAKQNLANKVEFNITMPDSWTLNTPTKTGISQGLTSHSITKSAKQADGSYKVTLKPSNATNTTSFKGAEGDVLSIPIVIPANTAEGMYSVRLTNISTTNFCGLNRKVDDYEATFILGGADALPTGTVAFHGNMTMGTATEDFMTLLSERDDIDVVDMRDVTDIDDQTVVANGNENLMVYLPEGLTVANDKNVISGGKCENFVIKDKVRMSLPFAFHADRVSYTREDVRSGGMYSICLPVTVNIPAGSMAYTYSSVDAVNEQVYFNSVDVMEANTPHIITTTGSTLTCEATDVDVIATPEDAPTEGFIYSYEGMEKGTITGCYALKVDGSGFGICGSEAYAMPFRGVIRATGLGAKFLSLVIDGEETTAVDAVSEVQESADYAYSLTGMRVKYPAARHAIYIINGKKVVR